MLFEVQIGKAAANGVLCTKFIELYEEIKRKNIPNIGWELINSKILFPEDKILKLINEKNLLLL